MVDKKAVVDYD